MLKIIPLVISICFFLGVLGISSGCRSKDDPGDLAKDYLSSKARIRAALPEAMRNDAAVEALLSWHRLAFHQVIVAREERNGVMKNMLTDTIIDLKSYASANQVQEALALLEKAREDSRAITTALRKNIEDAKEAFAAKSENPQAIRLLLDKLPIEYFVRQEQYEVVLERDLLRAISTILEVFLRNFDVLKTSSSNSAPVDPRIRKELKEAVKSWVECYDRYKEAIKKRKQQALGL